MNSLRQYLDILVEAEGPTTFTPTHFHKGNLGNEVPLMLHSDGKFYHQSTQNNNMGGPQGTKIVPWNGNAENRSAWNPASVDGQYVNGKPVEYPKGVTYKTFKADAPTATAPVATAIPVADPATNAIGVTPQTTVPNSPAAQSGKPAPAAADPEKEKKVARFKELLTKSGMLTATPAASTEFKPNYSLAPATATQPGIRLPAVKESVTFKSSIGRMLLESFDIGLEEAAATQLSPEEYKELAKLYGDLSVTYKDDPALSTLFAAYDKVKPSWSSDSPAADTALPQGTNLGIAQMQKELKAQGANLGTFGPNKDGVDGKMGKFTKDAIAKYPDIAKKYGFGADGKATQPAASSDPATQTANGIDPTTGQNVSIKNPDGSTTNPETGVVIPPTKTATAPKTGKVDQSGKPALASSQPAASTGNPNLDVLNKIPNPKPNQEHWVNGQRFQYRSAGFDPRTGQPRPGNGWYKNLDPSDKLQWNANRVLSSNKYTGPDDDEAAKTQFLASKKPAPTAAAPAGKQPVAQSAKPAAAPAAAPVRESSGYDEVQRIVSLVHYR